MCTVPQDVVDALAGQPAVGDLDPIFPLLTTDAAGFPHVCLLGRAELAADGQRIYAVLASPTTIGNLRRTGQATLVFIGTLAATYFKLTVIGEPLASAGLIGVRFEVATSRSDAIGVALTPPLFRVEPHLATTERWGDSARLLADLAI